MGDDIRDVLMEGRALRVRIVDWHRLSIAHAGTGDPYLPFGCAGAVEWLRRSGEILDGVEVEEEANDER